MAVSQAELEAMRRPTDSVSESQSRLVFLLQEGGAKTPFYFISAGADEPRLAKLMGDDRPIYGIQIPWPANWLQAAKSNDVFSIPRLEEFASLFVEALSEHLGSGPCILAGHSFAAILAFEAGRQFQTRGGKVDAVVIIDKEAHIEGVYRFALRNLRECWSGSTSDLGCSSGKALAGRINRSALIVRWLLGKAKAAIAPTLSPTYGELTTTLDEEGVPLRWPTLVRFYRYMHGGYHPTPIDCRGIVIRAMGNDRYASIRAVDKNMGKQMGWNGLFTKGLAAVELMGVNHNSIIRDKAETLASAIVEAITAVDRDSRAASYEIDVAAGRGGSGRRHAGKQ